MLSIIGDLGGDNMGKNRSLEAKRIKRIKQIRARPRFLKMNSGYIKTSQSPNRDRVPDEARSLFEYRKRLQPEDERMHFITALMDVLAPDFSKPVIVPRKEEHMRLKVNQMDPVERKLLIQNGKFVKVAILSNRDLSCVEFLEYHTIAGVLRRSITYSSYDRAMQVFHLQTVRWKETIVIPNVEKAPLDDL
jgi:hypothetical protein